MSSQTIQMRSGCVHRRENLKQFLLLRPTDVHHETTYMAMCVRRIFKMVHERNEEAGNEASKREEDCTHSKAGEGQPDEGPVPVKAAVRHLEHPIKPNQRFAPWLCLDALWQQQNIEELSNPYSDKCKTHKNILLGLFLFLFLSM